MGHFLLVLCIVLRTTEKGASIVPRVTSSCRGFRHVVGVIWRQLAASGESESQCAHHLLRKVSCATCFIQTINARKRAIITC
jgi:adenosyl cobinamide kinase/adenosyl cobinamide phosphate guanylyltransferase